MNNEKSLIEKTDSWLLPINGLPVTQIRIDYAFGLSIGDTDDYTWSLRIGGEFRVQSPDGSFTLWAEKGAQLLAPALAVLHRSVVAATAFKTGTLEISFTDNFSLSVPPGSEFEAWQLSGPGGALLVCQPGGEIAVWQPS